MVARALLAHKGRSSLTSLGIVVGLGAVVMLVAAGNGARQKLNESLESVGKDLILVRAGARNDQGVVTDYVPLTRGDAEVIRKQAGPLLTGVAECQSTQRFVATSAGRTITQVTGSVPEHARVRNWSLVQGRFYSDDEVKRGASVCVIGQTIRSKIFANQPALDATLRLDQVQLRVIGVLASKGQSPTGSDQDNQVLLPITTLQQRLQGHDKIELILAEARSTEMIDQACDEIRQVLRKQHHIRDAGTDDFDVTSVRDMTELAEVVSGTMQSLVFVIAVVLLTVGGIGIMNIMLVCVSERTHEIGLRLAVGARPVDILVQFLLEAVGLAATGGVVGVVFGLFGAATVAHFADWPLVITPAVVALALMVSGIVGIGFGSYPAWKASQLDPVDALRYE
jgi:putative ABC transport system permease protein